MDVVKAMNEITQFASKRNYSYPSMNFKVDLESNWSYVITIEMISEDNKVLKVDRSVTFLETQDDSFTGIISTIRGMLLEIV